MIALLCFFLTLFASPFKPKTRLEAENGRPQCRWFPTVLNAITIIRPETLVRWQGLPRSGLEC